MKNFDLIDDYLTNRLDKVDREIFEKNLLEDSALKREVNFQSKLIEGIKKYRMSELKANLQGVTVPTNGWTSGQLVAGVVSVLIVFTSIYLFIFKKNQMNVTKSNISVSQNDSMIVENNTSMPGVPNNTDKAVMTKTPATTSIEKQKQPKITNNLSVNSARPKKIELTDPSVDLFDESGQQGVELMPFTTKVEVLKTKMEVSIINNRHYNFHYQVLNGKMILYGPFNSSLYEVLEIYGDARSVFLYYKKEYYLIDASQAKITELKVIKDVTLIEKLNEFRSN